ncbi:MAG: hypothetical protein ACO4AU_08850 [bacterium]|jgi:hypothetical protein
MSYRFAHELTPEALAGEVQSQPLLLAQVLSLLAENAQDWPQLVQLDALMVGKLYMDFCVRESQLADYAACEEAGRCPDLRQTLEEMEAELQRQAGGSWWDAY